MSDMAINQYLTFSLAKDQYAVPVDKVREVLEYSLITALPKTDSSMKGIINLRGQGIPVIDLRLKFGLTETVPLKDTAIIVLEVATEAGSSVVGALADAVHEVVEISPERIEKAPRFGTKVSAEFIRGIGKRDDHFIIILDTERLFGHDDASLPKVADPSGRL